MEQAMAEPGAVVAGRIAWQAHDRVSQFGEALRQILHACGGFACAGACLGQELAGVVPAAGHIVEIVAATVRCEGTEHLGLRAL